MARVPGSFNSSANYEVLVRKPFDARQLVPSYESLLNADNWTTAAGQSIVYNGLVVAVANISDTSKNGLYRFFDPAYTPLNGGDVTNEANWHKLADIEDVNALTQDINSLGERVDAIENIDLLILDGGNAADYNI